MKNCFLKYIIYLILFTSCITESEDAEIINHIVPGDRIPYFQVSNEYGNIFTSDRFEGKKSLLLFFNTECPDCQRELPIIESVYRELKNDTSFCFVAIAREEPKESVHIYWENNNLSIPYYFDPDKSVFYKFANSMIPRMYIINPKGIVTYMGIENINLSSKEISEMLIYQ